MAKSPEEMKASMIAGMAEKTGKSLEEWLAIIRASKLSKHKEFMKLLKDEHGLIACEGAGRKADPFRYWLPEREAVWKEDPLYEIFEAQRRQLNLPFESLQQRKRALGDVGEPALSNGGDE